MNTLERIQKKLHQTHYLLTCPHCNTELVVSQDELHKELYKPTEQEYEYWELGGDGSKKIGKEFVSSDPDKDVYKDIKCCYCGHVWDEPIKDMYEKHCNPDGRQTEIFELNETETKRAAEFRAKHNHCAEFRAQGKLAFTALGQQFTYTIVPGGLGNGVSIKCNYCGEEENITDISNW